jgi:3-isopropylmalate dehydrogenase
LSDEALAFCKTVLERGGALLNGPGGGRYVYDLRRELDLFFKISPIQTQKGVADASVFRQGHLDAVDILVTRENQGGVYQGSWESRLDAREGEVCSQRFQYSEFQVQRFLLASARLAARRKGRMTVIWKESGVPGISGMWRRCAEAAARDCGVDFEMVDIDLMAYRLIREPRAFDVIATPNLFGDVIGDLGATLLGARGNSFSGNFNAQGWGVYQTNHGAAYDLKGSDRANPCGQLLSLAMLLRESFGLVSEAERIEAAMAAVWKAGFRTADVMGVGTRLVGTAEMGQRIAQALVDRTDPEPCRP